MTVMKEVTKDTFYAAIGDVDAIYVVLNTPWPYTGVYKMRHAEQVLGKIVPVSDPDYPFIVEEYKYYIGD